MASEQELAEVGRIVLSTFSFIFVFSYFLDDYFSFSFTSLDFVIWPYLGIGKGHANLSDILVRVNSCFPQYSVFSNIF